MHDDRHYEQLRRDYERQLDEDYQAWQRRRAGQGAGSQGAATDAQTGAGGDNPLESLGRAISSVVTVPASPEAAAGLGTEPRHVGGVYSRQTG